MPSQSHSILDLLSADLSLPSIATDGGVTLVIADDYLSDGRLNEPEAEGLAIQRMLTLARQSVSITFDWQGQAARRIFGAPALHPLAAVAIVLSGVRHVLPPAPLGGVGLSVERAKASLLTHRLNTDMFATCQLLVCVDHDRPALPVDLYDARGRLRSDREFESMVDDLISKQVLALGQSNLNRLALAVMLRELLENTDDHARTNSQGNPLAPNCIRGLIVKQVEQPLRFPSRKSILEKEGPIPSLEFSIFDSGVGYYDSYRRQLLRGQARGEVVAAGESLADVLRRHSLGAEVSLDNEMQVLLKCLDRHSLDSVPDPRPGHRGMGLYEVLRALQSMNGLFEVRTGRLHGYRSFLKGDLAPFLEKPDSKRPGFPRPTLLDSARGNSPKPTGHEQVIGSVVRVVVPLV